MENSNGRMWFGILLIIVAFFYKPGTIFPNVDPKIDKPEADIVALVEGISVTDDAASSKLAGLFSALAEKLDGVSLKTNLQVQYLMDYVGKNTFGSELMNGGSPKYPSFAPAVAAAMTKVLGSQKDTDPIAGSEKKRLARLFYGLSWKLYKPDFNDEYDSYKAKTLKVIDQYNGEDPDDPDPSVDCDCGGKGYIVHGDGHKTKCPCIAAGRECDCTGSAGSDNSCDCADGCKCSRGKCACGKPTKPPVKPEPPKFVPPIISPFKFVIPDFPNYTPRVGVSGFTVKYHLVMGSSEHKPVSAVFVDTLTINQQCWLHDYLHGMVRKPGTTVTIYCQCETPTTYCNCVATYGSCSCQRRSPDGGGSVIISGGRR